MARIVLAELRCPLNHVALASAFADISSLAAADLLRADYLALSAGRARCVMCGADFLDFSVWVSESLVGSIEEATEVINRRDLHKLEGETLH